MKVGIIVSGFGQYAVAPVWRQYGVDVEVVTPRDAAAVDKLIASDVDLISVHSPPVMHYEHVMKASDAGRNVLCNKPFGVSGKQTREMRDAAKKKGVLHFGNLEM